MVLTEYNEQLHIDNEKELSYQEGVDWEMLHGIQAMIETLTKLGCEDTKIALELSEQYGLSQEDAFNKIEDYKKMY